MRTLAALGAFAAALVMLSPVSAAGQTAEEPAEVAPPPPSAPARIAYQTASYHREPTSWGGGPEGLGTIGVDGSDARTLTSPSKDQEAHYEPYWSPDGRWVAYQHVDFQFDRSEVRVVPRDGGTPQTVSVSGEKPVWSPDGRFLAWTTRWGATVGAGIYVAEVLDSEPVLLLGSPRFIALPQTPNAMRISPDGSTIMFTLMPSDMYTWGHLYRVGTDGTDLQRLAEGLRVGTSTSMLNWSPDGTRFGFIAGTDSTDWDLHTIRPDGSGHKTMPSPAHRCTDGMVVGFAWSPGGDTVATMPACTPEGIHLYRLDGTFVRRLGADAYNMQTLMFSPDATRIIAIAEPKDAHWTEAGSDVFSFPVDGSTPQQLTFGGNVFYDGLHAVDPGHVIRNYGDTAAETAVSASQEFHASATTAVLAADDEYGYAIAATPLAAGADPLLTSPSGALPDAVRAELGRLGVTHVELVGPLSPGVEATLQEDGLTTSRLGNANPYVTAAAVAQRLSAQRAYVVPVYQDDTTGRWGTALAGSAIAAHDGVPLLFVKRHGVPRATRDAIIGSGISAVTILGNGAAVSSDTAAALRSLGVSVTRVSAADEYELSATLATKARMSGASATAPVVAGHRWRQSVTAATLAAASDSVMLLVSGSDLAESPATAAWLGRKRRVIESATLVGSPVAVRGKVEAQVERRVN